MYKSRKKSAILCAAILVVLGMWMILSVHCRAVETKNDETQIKEQKIIRELLPKSYFLVPGYGAQGATAKDIANAFNDDGLGAIVNSSRGIMCAWKKTGNNGEDYKEAARAEAIRMRDDIVAAIK